MPIYIESYRNRDYCGTRYNWVTHSMIMVYITAGVMVATWIVLGIYLWWVVKSGYEDTLNFAEGDSA